MIAQMEMFLIILFTNHIFASSEINLQVSSFEELVSINIEGNDNPIHLHLVEYVAQDTDKVAQLKKIPWLNRVENITISDSELKGSYLNFFLVFFRNNNIKSLSLINSNIEENHLFNGILFSRSLNKLIIIKVNLDEIFYRYLEKTPMPNLIHLELIDLQLKKKHIKYLKKMGVLNQLEYLDLSYNNFKNSIFTLFQTETEGNIKVLKLNKCGLTANFLGSYKKKFPALSSKISPKSFVKWDGEFFKNLTHLEIRNKTKKINEINKLFHDPAFKDLEVFYGFYFDFPSNFSEKQIHEEQIKILKVYLSSPLQTKYYNFNFRNITEINLLLKSEKVNLLEKMILEGRNWNDIILRYYLDSWKFQSLKYISLIGTDMSQKQLSQLINDYPQYCFDVTIEVKPLKKNPNKKNGKEFDPPYWPVFSNYAK